MLCDVSTSVTSASVFPVPSFYALHDAFRRLRSFVFERVAEVTDLLARERSFKAVLQRSPRRRAWRTSSATRTTGGSGSSCSGAGEDPTRAPRRSCSATRGRTARPARAEVFGTVSASRGRPQINPSCAYWNYGDSASGRLRCRAMVPEVIAGGQLEAVAAALADPRLGRPGDIVALVEPSGGW